MFGERKVLKVILTLDRSTERVNFIFPSGYFFSKKRFSFKVTYVVLLMKKFKTVPEYAFLF